MAGFKIRKREGGREKTNKQTPSQIGKFHHKRWAPETQLGTQTKKKSLSLQVRTFTCADCHSSVNLILFVFWCSHLLGLELRHKVLPEALLLSQLPLLQHHVEGVQEGVEGRIERHHQHDHCHVHLSGDLRSLHGHETQQAYREPTQEVGYDHGEKPASYGHVMRLWSDAVGAAVDVTTLQSMHAVSSHRQVDEELARGDQHKEDQGEHDHDTKGVALASKTFEPTGSVCLDSSLAHHFQTWIL